MKFILMVLLITLTTATQATTFYLTRHAEKVDDGSKDPLLTDLGLQRAENIASILSAANIKKIYSTNYQRTQLTAKPLADFLGVEIISYNPSKLEEFAGLLKQETENVLIVGHSNTTPMLTFLLSGKPVMNLDEVNYDNLYQVNLDGDESTLSLLKSLPSQSIHALTEITPLATHFFTGHVQFNMLFKDEVVGTSKHEFKQSGELYQLHEKTIIEKMNINANISTSVDKSTLAPISFSMSGSMGAPVDIKLDWKGQKVKGYSEMAREPFKNQGKLEISTLLRPFTLERTSVIMLAHMMPVTESQPLLIQWFNSYDGDSRLVNINYHGEETINTPAGAFETYKIEYSGGAPSQYYWIDKAQPKVVKIQVIKSPWSYELSDFELIE